MSIKVLIDMNLSPRWVKVFENERIAAVHWSSVGDPKAPDKIIMTWARDNGYIVFTNDLDFGTLLALTQAASPSVIQVRTQNVLPDYLGKDVIAVIKKQETALERGAMIVLDKRINRVRILPFLK